MAIRIVFSLFILLISVSFSVSAIGDVGDPPAPEMIDIQNIHFEVSNTNGHWISMGSEQNPEFLKSVSFKFKAKEGASTPASLSEDALRNAVKAAAEEKCRLIGAADRPAELPDSATLKMTADISSQQVFYVDQQFTGKYVCAVNLKP